MPIGPNIAVIGAGSRNAAIPVLATLFNLPPDMGDRIYLYDSDFEMLDLFDRVARAFAAYNGIPGISILATQDLQDALTDADAVIVCIDIGRRIDELDNLVRSAPVDFAARAREVHRISLIQDELKEVSEGLKRDDGQLVFNLVPPTSLSGTLIDAQAFHIDWPRHYPDDQLFRFAHRALRLTRGDEQVFEPLKEFKENPLMTAIMDSKPGPENRYDPTALEKLIFNGFASY